MFIFSVQWKDRYYGSCQANFSTEKDVKDFLIKHNIVLVIKRSRSQETFTFKAVMPNGVCLDLDTIPSDICPMMC